MWGTCQEELPFAGATAEPCPEGWQIPGGARAGGHARLHRIVSSLDGLLPENVIAHKPSAVSPRDRLRRLRRLLL